MALKRVDEFDGVTDADIFEFSIEGTAYEIDLSATSREQFFRHNQKYIAAARKVATRGKKSPKKATANPAPSMKPAAEGKANNDAIRDWARRNGKAVSDRGRIPQDIVDAFEKDHAPSSVQPAFSGV